MAARTAEAKWDALARQLHHAREGGILLDLPEGEEFPGAIADAYYVQDRTIAMFDKEPRAWKLGATAKAAQNGLGLEEPFAGPIVPGQILTSPAKLDVSGFACHFFEPEVAITLGKDIGGAIDADQARSAIASYHPAIEVINFRFRDGDSLDGPGMIADLGANGALVLGPAAPKDSADYWALTLDVRINGKSVAERKPPAPETDIGELLAWFAGHAAARGYALRQGDVITTGSQAGIIAYAPGDLVEADFGASGMASIQF